VPPVEQDCDSGGVTERGDRAHSNQEDNYKHADIEKEIKEKKREK
jgi:hypothetical protein